MKSFILKTITIVITSVGGLLLADSARAQVTVIDSANSAVSNEFDDATSLNPSAHPGSIYSNFITPWNGSLQTFGPTTDPTTSDFAQGGISASVNAGNYSFAFNNIVLNQASANSGHADLSIAFQLKFQIGPLGLPAQAFVFPNFAINGTVLNSGGFASISGLIDYYGVSTSAGVNGLMGTVTYGSTYNTPGSFSATAFGTPTGSTDLLDPGSVLTVEGSVNFEVDPADISVQSVPEPNSGLLVGFAILCGLLGRVMIQRKGVSAA